MKRREFLKTGLTSMATVVVGSIIPGLRLNAATRAVSSLSITITDAMKEMVTHNLINPAECYFWVYKMTAGGIDIPVECPGPTIVTTTGDLVSISVTNALDEPHAFFIPGRLPGDLPIVDSGPIAPGATVDIAFTAGAAGAFLYYDNLNEPVNRMMGLHGALIVMPALAAIGHKFTPYDPALVTPGVQKLYDDFGGTEHFPGLAWEQGDPSPWSLDPAKVNCPPFRQYVWLTHEASSKLFAEVGNFTPGLDYDPVEFMDKFLRSPARTLNASSVGAGGYTPEYFTINGQSGMFSHFNPTVTPMGRVGEPVVVHILNAGLWTHSMHLHANHFYVTSYNGVVNENPIWVDVYNVEPMDRIDYTVPFMRPPDVPNQLGIGLPVTPKTSLNGTPTWPPVQEFEVFLPAAGEDMARDIAGNVIDLKQRMSPLCYPMHDHSEPSQTSQGGNYNCGLISGIYFTGDRNTPGFMDFPMDEDFQMAYQNIRGASTTDMAAPPLGESTVM